MPIPKINPNDYVKIFNIRESVLLAFIEYNSRKKMTKFGLHNIEVLYLNGQFYFKKKDIDKYNLSNSKVLFVIKKLRQLLDKYVDFSATLLDVDFSTMSKSKKLNLYKKFIKYYEEAFTIIDVPVYAESFIEKRIIKKLERFGFLAKDFDILSTPLYESFHKRRHIDLIKLKQKKMSSSDFLRKWDWSNMALFYFVPVDKKFIDNELKEIESPQKELAEIKQKTKESKTRFNKLYNKLPDDLRKDADLMQELIAIRDYRFEMIIRGSYYAKHLLESIANDLQISYNDIINMTPEETLFGKIPKGLPARKKAFAAVRNKIYTGTDMDRIWSIFNKKHRVREIRGKSASHGLVTGPAKVIMSGQEIHKLEQGEVLVCDMTTPDYLSGVKKAVAIVTNLGGLTCHAAVIAREFGIPTVVGTGNATLVFEDGDQVEVDADKGTVKKL